MTVLPSVEADSQVSEALLARFIVHIHRFQGFFSVGRGDLVVCPSLIEISRSLGLVATQSFLNQVSVVFLVTSKRGVHQLQTHVLYAIVLGYFGLNELEHALVLLVFLL